MENTIKNAVFGIRENFPDPQHWLHDTTFYMYVSLQPKSHFEMVYRFKNENDHGMNCAGSKNTK
jgi:hypothetical protein